MGREIGAMLAGRGHEAALIIDADNPGDFNRENMKGIDVAIEFTTPATAYGNVAKCLEWGIPVVCGTTGWNGHLPEAERLCREMGGTFFYASNFSIGVNVFFRVNEVLAAMMDRFPEYEISMREVHHTRKKDSPSGTAVTLAEAILANVERKSSWVNHETLYPESLGIVSLREGDVPGTHQVSYESQSDTIDITHTSKNRRGLALGAIMAAEYAAKHKGVLTMRDLLGI